MNQLIIAAIQFDMMHFTGHLVYRKTLLWKFNIIILFMKPMETHIMSLGSIKLVMKALQDFFLLILFWPQLPLLCMLRFIWESSHNHANVTNVGCVRTVMCVCDVCVGSSSKLCWLCVVGGVAVMKCTRLHS